VDLSEGGRCQEKTQFFQQNKKSEYLLLPEDIETGGKQPNTTVKYLRSLGLDVMNEELKDLSLQNGNSLVFDAEKMKKEEKQKNKKPSEEPSALQAA